MSDPNFWSDQNIAKSKSKQLSNLKSQVESWFKFEQEIHDLEGLASMALSEQDKALEADIKAKFKLLQAQFEQLRLTTFLSDKYDNHDAILSIHAGAGGVDAQDWAEMLLRMYLRYAESKKFKVAIVDESRGGEA